MRCIQLYFDHQFFRNRVKILQKYYKKCISNMRCIQLYFDHHFFKRGYVARCGVYSNFTFI